MKSGRGIMRRIYYGGRWKQDLAQTRSKHQQEKEFLSLMKDKRGWEVAVWKGKREFI